MLKFVFFFFLLCDSRLSRPVLHVVFFFSFSLIPSSPRNPIHLHLHLHQTSIHSPNPPPPIFTIQQKKKKNILRSGEPYYYTYSIALIQLLHIFFSSDGRSKQIPTCHVCHIDNQGNMVSGPRTEVVIWDHNRCWVGRKSRPLV